MPSGGYIEYAGGDHAVGYDANWHPAGELPLAGEAGRIGTGDVAVTVRSENQGLIPWLQVRIKTRGEPIEVRKQ